MEYKLFFELAGQSDLIELPINPSTLSMAKSGNLLTYHTVEGQELARPTKGGLLEIKLSGVFTDNMKRTPIAFAELFQSLAGGGEPMVVSITRRYKDGQVEYITLPVLLASIATEEQGGTTDISYTMTLKEYKNARLSLVDVSDIQKDSTVDIATEVSKPQPPSLYVVKKGDTLYSIAKRFLGEGNRFMELARLNSIVNPNRIFVGQELRLC